MLRTKLLASIAAVGLMLIMTPESPAQHRGGGRGGVVHAAARPAVTRSVAPARVGAIRPTVHSVAPARVGAFRPGVHTVAPAHITANHSGARVQTFHPGLRNQTVFHDHRGFDHRGFDNRRFRVGFGFNPILGYWGWPGSYPYYNSYYDSSYPNGYEGYYPYGYSGGAYMPPADYYSGDAVVPGTAPLPATVAAPAQVDLIVPDPLAKVWFNDFLTTSTGTNRQFTTPDLQPGTDYTYSVKATWMQNGQPMAREYVVQVRAGARVLVDFTQTPKDVPIDK